MRFTYKSRLRKYHLCSLYVSVNLTIKPVPVGINPIISWGTSEYSAFREPSEGAKTNRGAIQRAIHTALLQRAPDLHSGTSSSSSATTPPQATPWEIYTDGSCEVALARQGRRNPAGWGIAVQRNKGDWSTFYGPVLFDRGHADFLGATLASNNTAELCAIAHAMHFLLQGTADNQDVTVFFDSVYAYKMATTQWTPRSNIALVQRVQELVQQVSSMRSLRWQHVYGHTGIEGNEKADRAADKGARGEAQWWPKLRLKRRIRQTVPIPQATTSEPSPPIPPELQSMTWTEFSQILVDSTEQVVGCGRPNKLSSFYTHTDMEHVQVLMQSQAEVWRQLQHSRGLPQEAALRQQLRNAKKAVQAYKQEARNRWVLSIIGTLEQAVAIHDMRTFYQTLPKLGVYADGHSKEGRKTFTLAQAYDHFKRTMNNPLPVSEHTLDSLNESQVPEASWLAAIPERAEIEEAMAAMRESAPGRDEVTIMMMRTSGELGMRVITNLVQQL